jgi:arsenate reductase
MVKHDLAKERPSRELLERLVDDLGIAGVMNTRGQTYKARGLDAGKLTKQQAIDLMLEEPNLMRRPLVVAGRKVVFGFDAGRYDELAGR